MTALADPLPLFHGTSEGAAQAVLSSGFAAPVIADRLRALAERYGVGYDELAEKAGEFFIWQRDGRDAHVHFTTNPRLAASYARRGSEIDYFGRQAVYQLQHPTPDSANRSWHRASEEWAKSEEAQTERPVLIEVAVPHDQLSIETLQRITALTTLGPEVQMWVKGESLTLLPEVASRYIVKTIPVAPCTCWRDEALCPACSDSQQKPGGWNGTYAAL